MLEMQKSLDSSELNKFFILDSFGEPTQWQNCVFVIWAIFSCFADVFEDYVTQPVSTNNNDF